MVKGTSRQVLVVKSPNPHLFEQAIFLLREDASEQDGVTPRELLAEAQSIAESYAARGLRKKRPVLRRFLWALCGAAPVAAAWLASVVFLS